MQTVYLIRHGLREDTINRAWRETATWPDDPPLCDHGWRQARLAGEYLADKGVSAMYCSPFLRAVQTAQGIFERTGVRFRPENALGEWLRPTWFARVPDLITPERIRRAYDGYDPSHRSTIAMAHPEEDERVEVYARVKRFIEWLDGIEMGTVALVGHGASVGQGIRALVGDVEGTTIVPICSITEVVRNDGHWEYRGTHTGHLPPDPEIPVRP